MPTIDKTKIEGMPSEIEMREIKKVEAAAYAEFVRASGGVVDVQKEEVKEE